MEGVPTEDSPTCTPSSGTLARTRKQGDVGCVFSNGGFGGIHGKLLERLKGRK